MSGRVIFLLALGLTTCIACHRTDEEITLTPPKGYAPAKDIAKLSLEEQMRKGSEERGFMLAANQNVAAQASESDDGQLCVAPPGYFEMPLLAKKQSTIRLHMVQTGKFPGAKRLYRRTSSRLRHPHAKLVHNR